MRKNIEIGLFVLLALAMGIVLYLQRHPRYSWERDLSQRLAVDFNRTESQVKDYIARYIPEVTDAQIADWTASGKLESMEIGGKRMYFRNAGPNLFRLVPELAARKAVADEADRTKTGTSITGHEATDAQTVPAIQAEVLARQSERLSASLNVPEDSSAFLALPKRMRVTFTLTIPANTLRPRKTLRCWLPYPRSDVARQTDVKFIEAGVDSVAYPVERITFSDSTCPHSSLYLEAETRRDRATTFYEIFEYTSFGEWHPIDSATVLPYHTESPAYKAFTSERDPHMLFSPGILALADSLTRGIGNPYLQAKALYTWVDAIPWASAREYSTIENIPEYVLANRHGDCGQQTLLLMTLCRAKGIPARWQSGLMMHPGAENLHDWCEIYFEGAGWVPVDVSFGETDYGGLFFFGGIDPYRMVVNNDFSGQMDPPKRYPRSDTVDFQRGEVEWEYGNLYYNQWDYSFQIEYLNESLFSSL